MKQIHKGMNPFAVNNAFVKKSTNGKRVVMCIPAPLHDCIDEIRYQEGITLRLLVRKVLAPFIGQKVITKHSTDLQFCSVTADRIVETTVILSEDEHNALRAIHHYWKVSYSKFLVDALIKRIVQEYGETYPNAPGMHLLKKIKQ